ncbi:MAG: DUF4114 domain-containing protein [Planctomycetes bacterium]|nr:DUF4114 domain-containing protein [Planctomycetota bacterium]
MTRIATIAILAAVAGSASADLIDPTWLQSSMDGLPTAVQSRILSAGSASSVGTTIPDYGDQIDAERFAQCDEIMQWTLAWQAAGQAPFHRLGYYTVASPTPADVTWVIGGSSSGLPSSASVSVLGDFGLAFYSGNNGGVNSSVYYSQQAFNSTGRDHLATILKRDSEGVPVDCAMFLSWEDNFGVDHDYNDFGMELRGITPAPGAAATLALGGLMISRRRRA